MRAFLISLAATAVIAVAAALVLESVDMSAADVYQSEQGNVRL